jgi:hypothetical protein
MPAASSTGSYWSGRISGGGIDGCNAIGGRYSACCRRAGYAGNGTGTEHRHIHIRLKGALDYLLWFHLYEAASPGWLDRTNRRLQREQGRTMLGYEPGAGVPWGLPGVYMASHGSASGLLAAGTR